MNVVIHSDTGSGTLMFGYNAFAIAAIPLVLGNRMINSRVPKKIEFFDF